MKIKGKSIRSISKVLEIAAGVSQVRLAIKLSDLSVEEIKNIGLDIPPKLGDYLMPSSIGKVTEFNVNGKENIRRDLPQEPFSVMYEGTTRDWHGGLHTNIMTRTAKRYPREYVPAPSETLQVVEINGQLYIASSELTLTPENERRTIHVCNLMLECFSEFEIFDTENEQIIGPTLKKLQWDILPKGKYPWNTSKPIIESATKFLDPKDRQVILHRMEVISRKSPDFLATGRGGFSGYFVYGFLSHDKYVLESIHLDNATYVFQSDWETLSQLTKNEIINGNVPHQRIIHSRRWRGQLLSAIDNKI